MQITDKNKCSGCNACYNICPVNAISMLEDKEGFKYPIIDDTKCTKCGLCAKTCPINNTKFENNENPKCYAYMAKDDIRKDSASGGAFAHLAYHFIKNDGYVCGAVYTQDWSVEHIVSNKIEDILRMQSSKYLQSDTKSCYKEIKQILEDGKKVLFSGTPCQVAGLKAFLRKDYENLYCLDLVCHGVPSPKVFKKYLDEIYGLENVKKYNFRSKEPNGWSCCCCCETTTGKKFYKDKKEDEFYIPFLKNLLLRTCCGNCKFNKLPRQGDLSIGDFWGINEYSKKLNDKKGTSVILANNEKAPYLINILKNNSKLLQEVLLKYALPKNHNITTSSLIHKNRDMFFKNIDKFSYKDNLEYSLGDKCDCMILNLWPSVNYGAMLTCYGVQCLLEKLGQNVRVINYISAIKLKYPGSFAETFAKKYLNLTSKVLCYQDLLAFNDKCNTFIVGSDQVWNGNVMQTHSDRVSESLYLLNFVNSKNKKISYSASFGYSSFIFSENIRNLFNYYLPQFSAISVREDDGKEILKNEFNIDSEQLIDGAFHIPQEKLDELTSDFPKKEDYIACFTLPYYKNKSWYKKLLPFISQKYNLPIKHFDFNANKSIEEWIAFIKNAKCIITDSYHGTVFSIIFEKDFIHIKNAKTQSRFDSLYRLLEFENLAIGEDSKDIDFDKLLKPRNYKKAKEIINKEVEKAEQWMKNALEKQARDNSKFVLSNQIFQSKICSEQKIERQLNLLSMEKSIKKQYFTAKVLSKITFGKTRKKYKELKKKLKPLYSEIRHFSKFDINRY